MSNEEGLMIYEIQSTKNERQSRIWTGNRLSLTYLITFQLSHLPILSTKYDLRAAE